MTKHDSRDLKGIDEDTSTWSTRLSWAESERRASFEQVLQSVLRASRRSIDYYFPKRNYRRFFARWSRIGQIGLASLAALLPLLAIVGKDPNASWFPTNPVWASVALGLAAGLHAFEKYSGVGRGWIRNVKTGLELSQLHDAFCLEITALSTNWKADGPSDEELRAALAACARHTDRVHQIVRRETDEWATDYVEVMRQLGQDVKSLEDARRHGAVVLGVNNGDVCESGWDVTIDGIKQPGPTRGRTAVFEGLVPGIHKFVVDGEAADGRRSGQGLATVVANTVATLELELR